MGVSNSDLLRCAMMIAVCKSRLRCCHGGEEIHPTGRTFVHRAVVQGRVKTRCCLESIDG